MKRSQFLQSIAVELLALTAIAKAGEPKTRKGLLAQIQENESVLSEGKFEWNSIESFKPVVLEPNTIENIEHGKRVLIFDTNPLPQINTCNTMVDENGEEYFVVSVNRIEYPKTKVTIQGTRKQKRKSVIGKQFVVIRSAYPDGNNG